MMRKLVGILTLLALLAILATPVLANGNPPSVECASDLWSGRFFKVQVDDGVLAETEGDGNISINQDGTWTNNDTQTVFRIVLKVGQGVGEDQTISSVYGPGAGSSIDLATNGLSHITFCFTQSSTTTTSVVQSSTTTTAETTTSTTEATTTTTTEPTTTTTDPTTTTTDPGTTTTSGGGSSTTTTGESTTTTTSVSTTIPSTTSTSTTTPTDTSTTTVSGSTSIPPTSTTTTPGPSVTGTPEEESSTTTAPTAETLPYTGSPAQAPFLIGLSALLLGATGVIMSSRVER